MNQEPCRLATSVYLVVLMLACLVACQDEQPSLLASSASPPSGLNFPYYMQPPIVAARPPPNQDDPAGVAQRSISSQQHPAQRLRPKTISSAARQLNQAPVGAGYETAASPLVNASTLAQNKVELPECLYQRNYLAKLDKCLTRRPYPTVGLSAFKNEDLMTKRGLNDKYGCLFTLTNGLFKNYQIPKFLVDSDSQCLDNSKVAIQMGFSDVSMNYLWSLRCLNRADQLLDDATMDGNTNTGSTNNTGAGICVGSSQSFGFALLQLSYLEANVELMTDVYKNWRVTNVTVAMSQPKELASTARSNNLDQSNYVLEQDPTAGTNIREFLFESLDGDELNWRNLNLFQNWSRNRLHANFVEQYRRFLWISLQRCLTEASELLPVKLTDVFSNQKYS